MKTLLCTLILAAFGAAAAKADLITITFDQPNQTGSPGQTLQFFGTITNNSTSTVFLNSDDLNLGGAPDLTTTDLFFTYVPISLAPGANSGDIELFEAILSNPLSNPSGTYPGSYDILGGVTSDASDIVGSAAFSVTTVPEPSSVFLLLGVLSVTLVLISKKARTQA